ncbi:MAG: hypothetical protein Q4G43_15795 [Mobilicoccus sp.]|nr:hypothetical protein [Mobilicoccus sp.]
MKRSADVAGLVIGLLALAIGGLGLWAALGTVVWSAVAVLAPVLLVAFGLIGILASRGS